MLRLVTLGGVSIEDAGGGRIPSPRPQRVALLLVVASAGRRGISRNRLRAVFWPDADDARARHSLSQTIYALRRDLGANVIEGNGALHLDPAGMVADVQLFREALARKDLAAAFDLYRGSFAAGFSLDDAPEFDRWLEEERAALTQEAKTAFESLAEAAAAVADHRRSAEVWRRLTSLDPLNSRYAASYMSALSAAGDRVGAVAHARLHAEDLRRELDVDPDPAVLKLTERIRGEARLPVSIEPAVEPAGREAPAPVAAGAAAPAAARPRSRAPLGAALAFLFAGLVGLPFLVKALGSRHGTPVLAVGQIRDLTAPDSTRVGGVLSEVLATSLARLNDLEVIANSRILELMRAGSDTLRSARTDAARRAGATEIIEGELVPGADGRIRLELRRVALERGAVRAGYTLTGTDRLALLDSVTSLIAADFRIGPPVRSLAEFTPRSPIALRLYEEGLRAYYQGDTFGAQRLLEQSLIEDSTFALAAFYAYRAREVMGTVDPLLEARALRLAARAPDRERLLIQTAIRKVYHDPAALALADTLVARYPHDPEALLYAVDAMTVNHLIGPRERGLLERAIAIDSASPTNPKAPCRLCESFSSLTNALRWADSGAAAERVLRRYAALRPTGAVWRELGMQQFYLGRYEEGAELLAKVTELDPYGLSARFPLLFYGKLLTGRLADADEECRLQLRREDASEYRWACPLLWRNEGRYRDAYALLRFGRRPDGGISRWRVSPDRVSEAVLELEMGRPLEALAIWEAIVPDSAGVPPGRHARELTWNLVRRGTAAAAAKKFDLTRRLADSAEMIGRRSLYGRDPLLHYFLRGLLAAAAGDQASAADLFRRSIHSWNFGYTRANLELGRSLIALGRAREAVPGLQSALRGGWDGSNYYVTRTELHELLAQAFAASGAADSAAVHYRAVVEAWKGADPEFRPRYDAARRWIENHDGRPRPAAAR